MQEYVEPSDFQGLLFFDGLDSLGRPVIIVNADAMGENKGARKSAFQFIVHTLEPVVIQVQRQSGTLEPVCWSSDASATRLFPGM